MKKENKKIINFNKKRSKLTAKKLLKTLRIPLAVIIAAAALFLSVRLLGNVAVSNSTDALRAIPSMFSSNGSYPYTSDSLNINKAELIGNDVLILNSDNAEVISSAPKVRLSYQLESADIKADTSNGRALLFSNTSNSVTLLSKTEKLGGITVPSTVNTASLARNGAFAVTYSHGQAQSVVEVYNNRFKKIFQWNCSNEFVSSIGLSSNGKTAAIAAIGSKNAEIYSRIVVFGVKNTEPTADLKLDGTLILKVIYTSGGKIIAIGDNKTVIYDKKGSLISEKTYPEASLAAVDSDDRGNTVLCCREFGGTKYETVRFSSSGKTMCDFTVDFEPEALSVREGRFAVSSGNKITVYSVKGEEVKTVEANGKIKQLLFSSNNIYTVEGSSICKY